MTVRARLAIPAILLVAVGIWVAMAMAPPGPTRLVPAWQLLPPGSYRAMGVLDPFLSWAPDSRSLVFSVFGLGSQRDKMFRWRVGEKKLEPLGPGISPSYVTDGEILYLRREPKTLFLRDLATGKEREIAQALKRSDFWPDVTGVTYDPRRKVMAVRMAEYTEFRTPGTEEYDLKGRFVTGVSTWLGEDVVDWSSEPTGARTAILAREKAGRPVSLRVVPGDARRGREIARGRLTSIAWSPDGKTIAYTQDKIVVAVRPDNFSRVIVARFGDPDKEADRRAAVRLVWSPNSKYLAAFVYVPSATGDFPLYCVLDMSKLEWD